MRRLNIKMFTVVTKAIFTLSITCNFYCFFFAVAFELVQESHFR